MAGEKDFLRADSLELPPPRDGTTRQRRRGPRSPVSIVFSAILIAGTFFVFKLAIAPPSWLPPCRTPHREATEVSYAGEHISWKSCGEINGHDLECSSIDVPLNQFDEKKENDKTFNVPLIRLRGHNAKQNILLNPGGPGGSGINFVHRLGEFLNTVVGEDFHLVSFDPRGVNSSTPMASCYPDAASRRKLQAPKSTDFAKDSGEWYAWTSNFLQGCQDTMGEHGRYVDTPQTAADMNSILDALGQEKMNYWGFSYGTILGQTYATLFPDRVGRLVIDGVANNFDWFSSRLDSEMFLDTQKVFDGFIEECIKAGQNCTLTEFADTKDELIRKLRALEAELKEDPIPAYIDNSNWGIVDRNTIWNTAIFPSLYKPARWHAVADQLKKLLHGNATDAYLEYTLGSAFNIEGDAVTFVRMNDGVSGEKNWPGGKKEVVDLVLGMIQKFAFADTEAPLYFQKQQWPYEKTHSFKQKDDVETANPILILSTSYDPVCPLTSARSARKAFRGSKLIEVLGYGHCSISVPSKCLAKNVRRFFNEGELPEEDIQCEVDGPYFMPPETETQIMGTDVEEDEDAKLYRALVGLAKEFHN